MSGHKAAYDDLDTTMIAYVGIVGTVITFFLVFAIAALDQSFEKSENIEKVILVPEKKRREHSSQSGGCSYGIPVD